MMTDDFFKKPILNSPYEYPARHWELDPSGQPTNRVLEHRRRAEFITPIPKPKKRRSESKQQELVFDEGKGLSTAEQQYDPTGNINEIRRQVDRWRELPNPSDWKVTPETARLLQHWRHHPFNNIRPFFCQIEAVETMIWLTEVAPKLGKDGKQFIGCLQAASAASNLRRSKKDRWETNALRCHVNCVILDRDWEAEFCRAAEAHPKVTSYAKNHTLGLEVPYRYGSKSRMYRPDFIVLVADGREPHKDGTPDLLHLVVEIKGYRREDAKEKKGTMDTYWIPGVQNLGSYGRWAFAEFRDVYDIEADFEAKVEGEFNKMIESVTGASHGAMA